jgi:hypothetical protein
MNPACYFPLLLIGWCEPRAGLGVTGEAAAEVTLDSRKISRSYPVLPIQDLIFWMLHGGPQAKIRFPARKGAMVSR